MFSSLWCRARFLFVALALPCVSHAQQESGAGQTATERVVAIDVMLSKYLKPDAPGAVVLVTDHGTPLFRKAYGLANVPEKLALDPAMSLRVGSITKQFAAAAIMLLVEQGKLSLSDKIDRYLPEFSQMRTAITVEQLLTHTSGIRNYTALPGFGERMASEVSVQEGIAFFKDASSEFAPGDRFAYSNSNYFLLGTIIERVTGMPYADFMARHVFGPLQLTHTTIETDNTPAAVIGYTQGRRKVAAAPAYSSGSTASSTYPKKRSSPRSTSRCAELISCSVCQPGMPTTASG